MSIDVTVLRVFTDPDGNFGNPLGVIHDLDSLDALLSADPADFPDDIAHYLWTWTDRSAGSLRARTDYLSRDLTITQGNGSVIETTWNPEGWVGVAGRVVNDGVRQLD